MTSSLDIIIVNWNAGRQLRACLESIVTSKQDNFIINRVAVVDNASSDGSIIGLEDLPLPLTIINNNENRGFGVGCNQGAKGSNADYILFLNPDTILHKDSLSKPLMFMEQQSSHDIGIVGIQLVDGNGVVNRTCASFPTPSMFFSKILGLNRLSANLFPSHFMEEWDHGESRKVDHVMGAYFMVRRCLFETTGMFDERFFVYLEDLDFSFRAKQFCWHSYYLTEAQAYHKGGGTSEQVKGVRLFYSLRSRILYGYKHFGWWAATGIMLGTLLLEPLARLTLGLVHCSGKEISETFIGYVLLMRAMPTIFKVARLP